MITEAGGKEVEIPVGRVRVVGTLTMPPEPAGTVLFAHGSGSSRRSPRNRFVAARLQRRGLGTLLLDLLTPDEERVDELTREHRFDIDLLGERLIAAADWLRAEQGVGDHRLGCFGASTGAAAALGAAAQRPALVGAVVSRGGRPDLASRAVLAAVAAPTLLVVGGRDDLVIELNHAALAVMTCPRKLEIVPGATHLFEEPGALDRVAELAADWFQHHLVPALAAGLDAPPTAP